MDYYVNAVETEQAAKVLFNEGMYRQAIYFFCLAIELYLKSRLYLVEHREDLEISHNIIGLYQALNSRFKPYSDLIKDVTRCRKYFNESRYPYAGDTSVYTREFAEEFLSTAADIKNYVDNECIATEEDLKNAFAKRN